MNLRNLSPELRLFLYASLAVGVLDAGDGVVFGYLTAGLNPIQVLQWIASALLGTTAFQGGLAAAALGAVLHFALAFFFTGLFWAAYAARRSVRERVLATSLAYGSVVWLFMNLLVLPNTGVAPVALDVLQVIHGLVGHALFVGLPAGLGAKAAWSDH